MTVSSAETYLPPPVEERYPEGCFVQMDNVILRYPIGPFVKGSIKVGLFSLFGHKPLEARVRRPYITALDGVSLTFMRGERVGIIGRNGAGKSTALLSIAGIYPIASGGLTVQGKIQALFNIGLGFEPDATGRENITYRGLAMGCTPEEIEKRAEEIIAFADIGEFIDMPIRTYSSGMYVRLAFSISTYLEGDILLIDEVFGAGDAAFQKKAVERIRSLVTTAGLVVMVTHDMKIINTACSRAIWLERGRVRMDGPAQEVAEAYLKDTAG